MCHKLYGGVEYNIKHNIEPWIVIENPIGILFNKKKNYTVNTEHNIEPWIVIENPIGILFNKKKNYTVNTERHLVINHPSQLTHLPEQILYQAKFVSRFDRSTRIRSSMNSHENTLIYYHGEDIPGCVPLWYLNMWPQPLCLGLPPNEAATKGHHTEQLHMMSACRRYMKQYHSVM